MICKIFMLAAVLALAVGISAQEQKKHTKITGFLIDNMCNDSTDKTAKDHATSCLKMESCEKSGFAVVSKDVTYKLDAEGNKRVLDLLKNSKTKKSFTVNVEGTFDGQILTVDSIEEVRP